jgi:hypothetical protein
MKVIILQIENLTIMKNVFLALSVALLIMNCTGGEKKSTADAQWILPDAPAEIEARIIESFPGAMPGPKFGDSLIRYMGQHYKVAPDKMLMGASTCVDDIIFTKNFHAHSEIKGPFHLGGLAGLPFTGVSGLEAFAHHIPEGGTMVLLIEPHIGLSEKGGWGYILRHEQRDVSTCCGALMGTLSKLQKGTLVEKITEADYQGDKIAELALMHEQEIVRAETPIIALTKVISDEAERQIRLHVLDLEMEHMKYIVIITGVLINTDYSYSDYQFIDHFMVYDVRQKRFVEEKVNQFNVR